MKNEMISVEITKIIKNLSLENQEYFLTLARVAAVAERSSENNKKHALTN